MTEKSPVKQEPSKVPASVSVEAERSRAVAETQAAMIVAKRWPRDQVMAMDRILNACMRPGLAETALYEYARGGSAISGPSIRLAEALAQNWGNIHYGMRELEQRDGLSVVEAFAWDVETNTRAVKIFQVPHIRVTRDGSYRLTDPRDIYELIANQGARRLRSCILAIIPGDVVEAAVAQCEATLKTRADVTPERIASMLERFSELGVTRQMIEARIQRRIEAITPGQMISLGRIHNSIRDGMSTIADWFRPGASSMPAGGQEAGKDTGEAAEADGGASEPARQDTLGPIKVAPEAAEEEVSVEGWEEFLSAREVPQDGSLKRFLTATAERNRMPVHEVKRAAVATPDKFWAAYQAWARVQADKERLSARRASARKDKQPE